MPSPVDLEPKQQTLIRASIDEKKGNSNKTIIRSLLKKHTSGDQVAHGSG
jgi:hypothetical protein